MKGREKMKKKLGMILIFALILSLLPACGGEEETADEAVIKIGIVGPWTGASADNGQSMARGIEIAIADINDAGGIKGYMLEGVPYDDQGIPEESVNAVNKLIFEDEVLAIVGPFNSACGLADLEVINREGVPMITPVAMADDIIRGPDFMFRNTLGNKEAAEVQAGNVPEGQNLYTDVVGCERVAILWENDDWGKGMSDQAVFEFERLEQMDHLVANVPFNVGTTDFYPILTPVLEKDPDIIYCVALAAEAIQIVKQARELGYEGLFMGEGGFNAQEFDKTLGELAYGCLFFAQWHEDFEYELSKQFVASHKKRHPDKVADMFTAIAYEAMYIVKDAIERAEESDDLAVWRDNVRAAIAETKDFQGVSGTISFDENGQAMRPIVGMQKTPEGAKIYLPASLANGYVVSHEYGKKKNSN
jgi:branched-chain amino acid transport system substrate-binding protein